MKKHFSPRQLYLAQKMLQQEINSIPKKNKEKFSNDLLKLVEKAHEDDYENFYFE